MGIQFSKSKIYDYQPGPRYMYRMRTYPLHDHKQTRDIMKIEDADPPMLVRRLIESVLLAPTAYQFFL